MKLKSILIAIGKLLLLLVLFFSLMYLASLRQANCVIVNKYATSEVAYADGRTAQFTNKNYGRLDKGDVATIHLSLPEERFYQDSTLLFYNYNVVTEVWFGDELLTSYGADLAEKNMMIGNRYFNIRIPDDAWGSEITITVRATMDNAISNFTHMRVYPTETAYQYYTDVDLLGFICAIVLFVLGLLGLFACVLDRVRGAALHNALSLIFTMLLISLWFISNEGIYAFFGYSDYFWQPLEYFAGYSIAVPLLLFYRGMTDKKSKWRGIFGIAAIVAASFVLAATVLNFTNILHYDTLMAPAGFLIAACAILMLVYSISIRAGANNSVRLMKIGMLVLVPVSLYEIYIRVLFKIFPLASIYRYQPSMALGILFFVACQICAFFSDLYDKQKDLMSAQIKAENLRKIIDDIPAGVCRIMPRENMTVTAANDLFYSILGFQKDETGEDKPKDMFAHMSSENKAYILNRAKEVFAGDEKTGEFEIATNEASGSPRSVLVRYSCDPEGDRAVTATVIDITDRKRMEEELRLSEERYRLALQQSGKVFFFFDVPTRTLRLSKELAEAFGLPLVVDNMPDNFISQGLVEAQSVENYRHFYERIIAGEETGDTVISCHMRQTPQEVLWYRIAFTTIFDKNRTPASTIITYEDMSAQYKAELNTKWKQLNLVSLPEKSYVVTEYDMTRGVLLSQTGGLFAAMPDFIRNYEEINNFVANSFIQEEDVKAYRTFVDRERLLSLFASGSTESSLEYRSMQAGSAYRWTSASVQMIADPYTGNVMAQFLIIDIHDKKSGQIAMAQNMDELRKELENSRIKVMVNQMQPHFLYNALSAIQTIVKTDPDYAYQLIYDFTVHLRSNIRALSSDAPIPFRDELKNIRAYMNIEQMRFGDDLKVKYEIDCDDFKVIPLSIQPLAENAARHGVYPKGDEGGTVTIRSYETVSAYIIEVEDDGTGFDVNEVLEKKSDSVGLKSLIFRLKSLMNADVTINSRLGAGTKVTVTIPKGGAGK